MLGLYPGRNAPNTSVKSVAGTAAIEAENNISFVELAQPCVVCFRYDLSRLSRTNGLY